MIIVKVINPRVVQVAFANQLSGQNLGLLMTAKNRKQLINFTRTLVNSAINNQKITTANNQHLIPIARNISFRQCAKDPNRTTQNNAQVFSISASRPTSHFISADLNQSIFLREDEAEERESPLETLKRKAKDVVEKRESTPKSKYYGQSFNETLTTASERKLVVLMSWLEAKEKHIEKYREFYLERGFDVLNVKTSPLDLLLPNIGAKKISKDFVRFLVEKQYSNVVLHGFSVGGYMFGQVLLDIDRQEEETKRKLLNSIRGLVFDSLVPFEGICVGVSRSITSNKLGAKVLEQLLRLYLILGNSIATKHYRESSDKVWGGPLKCPSLFLMSKDDKISDHRIVGRLVDTWRSLGIETTKKIFDNSPHVQLFQKHHDTYVDQVETLLKRINMN